MSTKPDTDTRWTANPAQGVYWWRLDANDTPDPVLVEDGLADGKSISVYGGEFLGPISPSDFEQLIRLRQIAAQVVIALDATVVDEPKSTNGLAFQQYENFDAQLKSLRDAANALREALAHTGEQS